MQVQGSGFRVPMSILGENLNEVPGFGAVAPIWQTFILMAFNKNVT